MMHPDERRKNRQILEAWLMNPDDTLLAFNCCVSLPPNCEDCPLFDGERQDSARMEKCKEQLKDDVRYWLSQESAHQLKQQKKIDAAIKRAKEEYIEQINFDYTAHLNPF